MPGRIGRQRPWDGDCAFAPAVQPIGIVHGNSLE